MTPPLQQAIRILSQSGIFIGILCMSVGCKDTPTENGVDSDSSGAGKEAIPMMDAPFIVLDDGRKMKVELIYPTEYEPPEDLVETLDGGDSINKQR